MLWIIKKHLTNCSAYMYIKIQVLTVIKHTVLM